MPETIAPASRLSRHLAILGGRSRSADGISQCDQNALRAFTRDQLEVDSRVEDADGALLTSNGANTTIALYDIDQAAGLLRVGGAFAQVGALNDAVLIGAGAWAKSFALDGTAPVALTADGKTCEVALVAWVDTSSGLTPTIGAVFGAEANDGAEVAPTAQQIRDALDAALSLETPRLANADLEVLLVVGRVKIQREAVDTITMTHAAAASDANLRAERLRGFSLPTTVS